MTVDLDQQMEHASEALARMDYLRCEELALDALTRARSARDWALYARILLPLQESRRQRRMIAADGGVRFHDGKPPAESCCLIVTKPYFAADARKLRDSAAAGKHFVEVLFVDSERASPRWRIKSFAGPAVACEVAALDEAKQQASDWFLDACEALGDAALKQVDAPVGDVDRVAALEQSLEVVTDHEILHQRLWDAAMALCAPART